MMASLRSAGSVPRKVGAEGAEKHFGFAWRVSEPSTPTATLRAVPDWV